MDLIYPNKTVLGFSDNVIGLRQNIQVHKLGLSILIMELKEQHLKVIPLDIDLFVLFSV